MIDSITDAEAMKQALRAIHDEAARLIDLPEPNTQDLIGGLELIASIARYKIDIRSAEELKRNIVD